MIRLTTMLAAVVAVFLVVGQSNASLSPSVGTTSAHLPTTGSQLLDYTSGQQFVTSGRRHAFTWVNPATMAVRTPSTTGTLPVVTFDGSLGAISPDHADWWPGTHGPLAVGVWVKPDDPTLRGTLFAQYHVDYAPGQQRAWLLQFEGPTGIVLAAIRDEDLPDPNVMKPRFPWPLDGAWHHLAFVFWGEGSTFNTDLLLDGVVVANDHVPNGGGTTFDGMRDVAQDVSLGFFWAGGVPIELYQGEMAMGECGPFWVEKKPTVQEWTDYIAHCQPLLPEGA